MNDEIKITKQTRIKPEDKFKDTELIWTTILENKDKEFKFHFWKHRKVFSDLPMNYDEFESEMILAVYKRMLNFKPDKSAIKTFFNNSCRYAVLNIIIKAMKEDNKEIELYKKLKKDFTSDV